MTPRRHDCGAKEIAATLNVDRKTIAEYPRREDFTGALVPARPSPSRLDPWKPQIERWLEQDRYLGIAAYSDPDCGAIDPRNRETDSFQHQVPAGWAAVPDGTRGLLASMAFLPMRLRERNGPSSIGQTLRSSLMLAPCTGGTEHLEPACSRLILSIQSPHAAPVSGPEPEIVRTGSWTAAAPRIASVPASSEDILSRCRSPCFDLPPSWS